MNESGTNKQQISKARITAVMTGLGFFGVAYNWLVSRIEAKGYDEGYTSDLVVLGTLVTVVAVAPLLGLRRTVIVLTAFVASGGPMSVGSKMRYRRMRERERRGYGYNNGSNNGRNVVAQAGPVTAAGLHPAAQARRGLSNGYVSAPSATRQ